MRLIDAEFEEKHYASMLINPTPDVTQEDKRKAQIVIDALKMAKTVDAEQVVRCKDCKHFINRCCYEQMHNKIGDVRKDNDFCCWAERRESDTE